MERRGIHLGNPDGIKRAIEKAKQGKDVVVAFLGGSITQGSLASKPSSCYAYLVYQWWKKTFPDAGVTYINAGIGGTSSLFGVARVQEDVLKHSPDFLVIDFTVNDEDTDFFMETYESLIRRILSDPSQPAVMALCNVFYDDGKSAFEHHKKIINHYQIPYVSMKETLYQDISDGLVELKHVTSDGLHPNDAGHKIIADLIIEGLEEVGREDLEIANGREIADESETTYELETADKLKTTDEPKSGKTDPVTKCLYREASRIQNQSGDQRCTGFLVDNAIKYGVTDVFKGGWTGFQKGDCIVIEAKGSCLSVQYRRTVKRPAPVAMAYLDGDRDHGVILDGNFDEDWGDCLAITPLLHHGTRGKHEIEIEIIKGVGEKETPFYLVSIIQSGDW
jgi:lysophospholipase L1-like esterase